MNGSNAILSSPRRSVLIVDGTVRIIIEILTRMFTAKINVCSGFHNVLLFKAKIPYFDVCCRSALILGLSFAGIKVLG